MHVASANFQTELDRIDHKRVWEIDVAPDRKVVDLLDYPFEPLNQFTENSPNIFKSSVSARTFFEPNTNRNGPMWLMSSIGSDEALRSSELSDVNGEFVNKLEVKVFTWYDNGKWFPYDEIGFSTMCDNGDYAVDFDVIYNDQTTQVRGNINPIYKVQYLPGYIGAWSIKFVILKWSAPKARAVISRVFYGERPYTLTNSDLTQTPNVFKELESDGDIGSVSSNQLTFGFYNSFGLSEAAIEKGALVSVRYGIKTDAIYEVFSYGQFYITSGSLAKSIFTVSAQDKMSEIAETELTNFTLDLSASKTYKQYISGILPVVFDDDMREPLNTVMIEGTTPKPYRKASNSDIMNEFNLLTGSCISFSDVGTLKVYACYNSATPFEIPDENIISFAAKKRFVPDVVRIYKYTLEAVSGTAPVTVFDGSGVTAPSYDEIGPRTDVIPVEYNNVMALNPYSGGGLHSENDVLYATNGFLWRQWYGELDDPYNVDLNVYANNAYKFSDKPVPYIRQFGYSGKELYINSYIAALDGYYSKTSVSQFITALDKTMEWVRTPFVKTKNEYIMEMLSDPRLELGDRVTAKGITGIIYRLEVNGSKTKLTIRGE